MQNETTEIRKNDLQIYTFNYIRLSNMIAKSLGRRKRSQNANRVVASISDDRQRELSTDLGESWALGLVIQWRNQLMAFSHQ